MTELDLRRNVILLCVRETNDIMNIIKNLYQYMLSHIIPTLRFVVSFNLDLHN
jgi:hypothetical protein